MALARQRGDEKKFTACQGDRSETRERLPFFILVFAFLLLVARSVPGRYGDVPPLRVPVCSFMPPVEA